MSSMISTLESPNPLRPYYRAPSIGLPKDTRGTTSSATYGLGSKNGTSASSYASSARSIFNDIDYSDYLSESSPSVFDSFKKQFDIWLYRYVSILLAQPFDVAKTVLQAKNQGSDEEIKPIIKYSTRSRQVDYKESYQSDDSDPDEPTYFTSKASHTKSETRQYDGDSSVLPIPRPKAPLPHQLDLKASDSILEVLGQEWMKEGILGVWKGTNVTFVNCFLLETLEKWSQGLLSAILNIPEPIHNSGLGINAEIPYAWSNCVVMIASAITSGLVLAPLDLIRTKLIMTSTSLERRTLMSQQQEMNSYFCHPTLLLPTILHSLVTPTIIYSAPLLLRSYVSIDPVLTPSIYQMTQLATRLVELFFKLPLETVLRRAQMKLLKQEFNKSEQMNRSDESLMTITPVGDYRGIIGTMWLIVREEGSREYDSQDSKRTIKPVAGQGLAGLWRGWRVGMWGLVGVWGLRVLNGSGGGMGEF